MRLRNVAAIAKEQGNNMSYVDNALIKGEQIIYRARVSWWAALPATVISVLLSLTFILIPVAIVIMAVVCLRIYSTELAITNKRVIAKFGFIRRNTVELKLDRIEGLRVNQGIFGRIFNYGSVVVSGTGVTQAPIPAIDRPLEFRRLCLETADSTENAPSKSAVAG